MLLEYLEGVPEDYEIFVVSEDSMLHDDGWEMPIFSILKNNKEKCIKLLID